MIFAKLPISYNLTCSRIDQSIYIHVAIQITESKTWDLFISKLNILQLQAHTVLGFTINWQPYSHFIFCSKIHRELHIKRQDVQRGSLNYILLK